MSRTSAHNPLVVVLPLVVFGAFACGEDFTPYNRLTSLRVLAIQSDPVAPQSGEATTLTPLTYSPPEEPIESYDWSWCPFPGPASDGFPCLVQEEELAELAGAAADSIPPFDLGGEPTAEFENTIDPALLELLCEGMADAPQAVNCEGGFPVQIKLTVQSSSEVLVAVRALRLRYDPDTEANENPRLDELVAVVDGEERVLGDDPEVVIPRGRETVLRARIPEEAAELYQGTNERGEPAEVRERLTLTWFVETGETEFERTGFIDGAVPLADALENEWEPAPESEYGRESARIFVVVRDDRGGAAWRSAGVALEEGP